MPPPARVVTLGELLLRLSPAVGERLLAAPRLDARFGGAEANVAVGLARLGVPCRYLTRLPEGLLGDAAAAALAGEGLDPAFLLRGGSRLGLYFLEPGAAHRPSAVAYDRGGSAFSELRPAEVAWDDFFAGSEWLHLTGITPALGELPRELVAAALATARRHGLRVSWDLNYRPALWDEASARRTLLPLLSGAHLVIANTRALSSVLAGEEVAPGADPEITACRPAAERLLAELGLGLVALTRRAIDADGTPAWSAGLLIAGELYETPLRRLRIVDRQGAGDAFAAALITALLRRHPPAEALARALAAGSQQHEIEGDLCRLDPVALERWLREER